MKNGKLSSLLNTPLGVVVILGAVVLVVEYLLMIFHVPLMAQFGFSHAFWDFTDPILLTLIVAPLLYFLVFRKLHDSEERFRQFHAIAPNAVVIVDEQGRITDWNLAAQKMFQYSSEEAVGQMMHQLIVPLRYRDDAARGFARFQETGSGPVIGKATEVAALRRDGGEFPVELSISAVRLKGRWHAIGIIHDITERKQTEAAFTTLVGTAAANIGEAFFHETVHSLSAWLGAECVIVGELVGENRVRALAMQLDGQAVEHYEYALPGTPCNNVAHRGYCEYPEGVCQLFPSDKDLSDLGAESYVGIPIRDKTGKTVGVLCAISRHKIVPPPLLKGVFEIIAARAGTEIERRRAEERISAQQAEIMRARLDWKAVFDSVSQPIFLHDNEFRVIRANRAYAERAGKSFEEIIGQPYYALFPKSGAPLPSCQRAMEKAEEEEEEEEEEVAVDGAIFRSRSFCVRSEQGACLYSVHILEDITERKRAERRQYLEETRLRVSLQLNDMAGADEKAILDFILEEGIRMTGSRYSFMGWINEDASVMTIHSWSREAMEACAVEQPPIEFPIDKAGIWAEPVRNREAIIINDYAQPHPQKHGYPSGHVAIRRYLGVPVFDGERVAMIAAVANKEQEYDESDVNALSNVMTDAWRVIQRNRAERELRESEERFYHLFSNMSSGVAIYQPDAACETFTFKSVNKAVERIDQMRREDVVGREVEEVFPGVRAFGLLEVFQRVCRSGSPERLPTAFYQDERISGWRDNYVYRLKSGEIVAVYDDVSERKENEKALIHTNWALMTLSANNEALVRAASEEELLQSATRAIVERGGYCMARVSYADDNPEKSLRRVAWAGTGEDFFAEQPLTWADTEKGQVPIARAIRSGTPQVCRDIASDPGFAPWKDAALAQGYASNIGLPLSDGSRIFGGLSIYSSEKNAFGDEDAKLLTELANNLAYGIVTLRVRTERKLAEQKRLEAGIHLKDVLEDAIGAIAATLEQRDPYTAGHQRRVAQLAAVIAEEMGLAREVIEGIHFGGMIHDLGKISVPAEILGKPGRLTDIELGIIKVHAEAGYRIVKDIEFPWPVAAMVRQHHERLDGSGYPQGLAGEQIALEARILAVADVVEAMSANRPYRPGFGMDAALDEITRGRGTQLDARAVDACLRVIREKGFVFVK